MERKTFFSHNAEYSVLSRIPWIWGGGRVGIAPDPAVLRIQEKYCRTSNLKCLQGPERDGNLQAWESEEMVPKKVQDTRMNSLRRNIPGLLPPSINSFLEEYQALCSFKMLILLTTYILNTCLEVEFLNLKKQTTQGAFCFACIICNAKIIRNFLYYFAVL